MAPRYQPLAEFLAAQPPATVRVTLTFAKLGAIVGRRLPPSAWGRSWLTSGWRVTTVSVSGGREAVTFVRADSNSAPTVAGRSSTAESARQRRRDNPPRADQ